jgi:hypothetical protein
MPRPKTFPAVLYEESDGNFTLYFVKFPKLTERNIPTKKVARQIAKFYNHTIRCSYKRKK